MSATDVSNRGARLVFFVSFGAETDIYIRKLRITGSSLPQTTAKQTAANIHAETPNKKSTHPADEWRCCSNRRRCPRQAKVCVFELHLLPPCPSQWQFKLNGSGEMICTCLWSFRNVKCGDTCPPPHSWPWAPSVHEGWGLAPTGNVSLESGANNAQFLWGLVKLVLTFSFFFFFLNHPIQHFWCEGKPMHDYILQLSFIYTIKGHVNVSYNWI